MGCTQSNEELPPLPELVSGSDGSEFPTPDTLAVNPLAHIHRFPHTTASSDDSGDHHVAAPHFHLPPAGGAAARPHDKPSTSSATGGSGSRYSTLVQLVNPDGSAPDGSSSMNVARSLVSRFPASSQRSDIGTPSMAPS